MCCQNHDVEVGAELTPVHEKTGSEIEWVALSGFQVCCAQLLVRLSQPEAAKSTLEDQADVSQETKREKFAKTKVSWSIQDQRQVCFTERSLFELFHPPNHQRDHVSVGNNSILGNVTLTFELLIWGMLSFHGLPDFLKVPRTKI